MKLAARVCCGALALTLAGGRVTYGQNDDLTAGDRLYHLHCAECHGVDGAGGRGPDLTRGVYRHGSTEEALYRTIARGIPGTPMPATSLSDQQLRQILRYVRGLAGSARVAISGNVTYGEKLFRAKGGCMKCHMVRGQGGSLGPDLSSIGTARSPSHLRASVLRPDEEINPAYWAVSLTTSDGTSYSGIRLNEDTYTIQILDLNESLHSFAKKDLQVFKVDKKKSLMPSYAGLFADSELDDLVAYLYSLERKAALP